MIPLGIYTKERILNMDRGFCTDILLNINRLKTGAILSLNSESSSQAIKCCSEASQPQGLCLLGKYSPLSKLPGGPHPSLGADHSQPAISVGREAGSLS